MIARDITLLTSVVAVAGRAGVVIQDLRVDEDWGMRQGPVTFRTIPKAFGVGTMEKPFYRTLFRWRRPDGARECVALEPIIASCGGRYELDAIAMGKELLRVLTAALPSNQEAETNG